MAKQNRAKKPKTKKGNKSNKGKKIVDEVKLEGIPAKINAETTVETVETPPVEPTKEEAKESPTKGSSSDVESQEEKPKGKFAQNDPKKKETPEKEDLTDERQNENNASANANSGVVSEDTSTADDSNPTAAPSKDSSSPTTNKVGRKVKEQRYRRLAKTEVPHWAKAMYSKGWLGAHNSVAHPETGEKIEVHACTGFDKNGRPIEIESTVPNPSDRPVLTKYMTEEERESLYGQFDTQAKEAYKKLMKDREKSYAKINRILPSFLHLHLKKVWAWNNEKRDKALNVVGIAKGLIGGKAPYVVLIEVDNGKGGKKLVRRNFKNISTVLPDGIDASPNQPLRDATDVEKEVDKKLLVDKSTKILIPFGYDEVIENNLRDERFHTILVWNSGGKQYSFFASPVDHLENKFQWVALDDSHSGYIGIHNNAIQMAGSIGELMRVTAKANQEHIENMLFVSIPEQDHEQFDTFMEIMRNSAVDNGETDGKENGEEK